MPEAKMHSDCVCYTPVDAAKGICDRLSEIVHLNTDVCVQAELKAKCKYCHHFFREGKDDEIIKQEGVCKGFEKDSWVYGELGAENCKNFLFRSVLD